MLRKYLDRQYIGFIVSLIAMNIVVLLFRDMFLFSKGGHHLPSWIKDLPHYLMPPWIFVWCLIPAALIPKITPKSMILFSTVIVIAPLSAVIPYFIKLFLAEGDFVSALVNSAFNWFFVIAFYLSIPVMVLITLLSFIYIVQTRKVWWNDFEDFLDHFEKEK